MGDRDNGATVRLAATIARSRHEADGGTMLDGIHPDTIVEMALAAKREVDGLRTELAEARAALGTAKHQRDEWMRFCDKAERERDEAQREVDRLHPCADSQNEDACGECVACLRVGMDAAIASRNEFRAALAHAEATIAKLREAMP